MDSMFKETTQDYNLDFYDPNLDLKGMTPIFHNIINCH